MASGGQDLLFLVRNNFYLGAYQAAINESHVEGLTEAESIERDCLVYRSYIALGTCQEKVLDAILGLLNDPVMTQNPTVLVVGGTILAHEKNYAEALKFTNASSSLEVMALNVQMYLKMDRPDYAEKQLKSMQQLDEDHTLTQLSNAWLNVALGGSKVQEAFYIFQELCEKYTWTVPLMNGCAVCNMCMGHFDDAENTLLEALSKDAKNADTLANLVVCSLHLGKPITRHLNQLRSVAPSNAVALRFSSSGETFDWAVAAFAKGKQQVLVKNEETERGRF
ncbi:hypothetical protein CBR_g34668 [Chara braunii]|uniref:Coatomer subunit epsilon n=1 Tax=Chara braunii TaxID=69332 RepID=A0A388JYV3_CHABU|nr:hypothetical protein CBR_g34668 [Chara braunii]|eukprot:GBG62968.1 hypothetical protein CBR_g34668 [Chara braunii]